MTTTQVFAENFYSNTLTSDIVSATWDINFDVTTPPVNKKWFLIISAWNISKREIVYFHDVIWNTIYVKWINRKDWKTHTSWETIWMYDVAEWFNFFSNNISTCFYPEKTWNLTVKVWWWSVLINGTQQELSDTDLTLSDNNTNNIYFDYSDNTIKTTTWSYGSNLLVSQVTTSGWAITWVINKVPKALTWLTWPTWQAATIAVWSTVTLPAWSNAEVTNSWSSSAAVFNFNIPKWEKWDIWEPGPAWQTITDNIVSEDTWIVVTTNNTSFIKVQYSNWIYTLYELDWWNDYDSNNNELWTKELYIWTFQADWISYSNWNFVNKLTGVITYVGKPAYRDQQNIFSKRNTFNNDVLFKSRVSFPYAEMTLNWTEIIFDAEKWTKQYITLATWPYTISFTNLRSWCNYEFALISSWATSLSKWTITSSDTITSFYSINNSFTNWMTLTPDVHLFVCDTFSTAIHISYLGYSRAI